MQTNMSPAGVGKWARRTWLLPLILSLFGCGGGGSADETPASVQATGGGGGETDPTDEHASSDDFTSALTSGDKYGSAERSDRPVEDDPGLHPGLLHRSCST